MKGDVKGDVGTKRLTNLPPAKVASDGRVLESGMERLLAAAARREKATLHLARPVRDLGTLGRKLSVLEGVTAEGARLLGVTASAADRLAASEEL